VAGEALGGDVAIVYHDVLKLWPSIGPYMAGDWVAQFHIGSQGGVVEVAYGTLVPHCLLKWTYTNIYMGLCESLHM
jgi:hypothetical protein